MKDLEISEDMGTYTISIDGKLRGYYTDLAEVVYLLGYTMRAVDELTQDRKTVDLATHRDLFSKLREAAKEVIDSYKEDNYNSYRQWRRDQLQEVLESIPHNLG